ncbi:MAG TPA: CAP domain-containing protein [Anaerolineales bacterium]|nr:CAP domain-containing protein [Anaerolineales bacterium]
MNALRASHGLPPYSVSSILMGTAQGQADYMASIGSVTHTGPGGASVTQRLLAAGYPLAGDLSLGGFRSENIVGSPGMTAEGAVSSWTGDDIHLHTMLSADLQEIGAGVAEQDGVTYFVIDCARPTGSGVPVAYTPGAEAALNGGDDIIVPVAISTPNQAGDLYHEVEAGQSLWAIAIAYGVKINDIRQLNRLDPATTIIQRGVKLLVKRVGTPTPASPTQNSTPEPDTAVPSATALPPSATAVVTPTPTVAAMTSAMTGGGAVAAIILTALVAAALVAWFGRSKPV